MQGVKTFQNFVVRDEVDGKAETFWAIAALAVVAALVAVIAILYIHPTGQVEYRAQMTESGGIAAGTEVRVAGVPIGKVREVTLGAGKDEGKVNVTMAVDDTVFVGDQTSLQVRMLTVVGGAYVALLPAGERRLGTSVIPPERTAVPYSTAEVIDDAAKLVPEIDTPKLRKVAVTMTDALDSAPGAVRGILSDVEKLTGLVNQQQNQIRSLADIGEEYTTKLADQKKVLVEMIRRIRAVLPVMVGYKDRGILTYNSLGDLVLYVGDVLGKPYMTEIKPQLDMLTDTASAEKTQKTIARMDTAITALKQIVDKLSAIVYPGGVKLDFSEQVIDDRIVCIPIAGRTC